MNALDAIRSADGDERARLAKLYLDELEPVLTGQADRDPAMDPVSRGRFDPAKRREGADWPAHAHTMIGQRRLRSLRQMAEAVIERGIPGDFIETGVWRGGACRAGSSSSTRPTWPILGTRRWRSRSSWTDCRPRSCRTC